VPAQTSGPKKVPGRACLEQGIPATTHGCGGENTGSEADEKAVPRRKIASFYERSPEAARPAFARQIVGKTKETEETCCVLWGWARLTIC